MDNTIYHRGVWLKGRLSFLSLIMERFMLMPHLVGRSCRANSKAGKGGKGVRFGQRH
jgi:hypothetical protein